MTAQALMQASLSTNINVGPECWTKVHVNNHQASFRGYLFLGTKTLEAASATQHIERTISAAADDTSLIKALSSISGHFAFVVQTPGRIVASVDHIRSIPLAWVQRGEALYIDDHATRLRDTLGLGPNDLDPDQVLAVAMSGYTIGSATLYRGLNDLSAGEALVMDASGVRTLRWFVYDAWKIIEPANPARALSELHRTMIERLAASAAGRPICVPLSAGLDSRFVAAGLKAVGYKDVLTFSYGRAGNHEAETAKAIAERLGFRWTFVPFTTRTQREMFADEKHEHALWHHWDSATSVPFEQDWQSVSRLIESKYLPSDAIIVNGQSGDYITGNHAPTALMESAPAANRNEIRDRVTSALIKKHYGLWARLVSQSNNATVEKLLRNEASDAGAAFGEAETAFGVHEMLEYQDRQAKYVVSGQRTYDALGLDWRLPLWDADYVEFWRHAPASLKRNQKLYRDVLMSDNWGGVFENIPVNRKTITPSWIRPIRFAAKVASAPLGKTRWHATERRFFNWWMDPLRVSAVVPYARVAMDNRGPRHAVAYLAEKYLRNHGVDIDRALQWTA